MSEFSGPSGGNSLAFIDKAETFVESDVSLSLPNLEVAAESIQFVTSDTLDVTNNIAEGGFDDRRGVRIDPSADLDEVTFVTGPVTEFHTMAYITRRSDSTVVATQATNGNPGETVTLTGLSLSKSETYDVMLDAEGASWDRDVYQPASLPIEGSTGDVIDGTKGNGNVYGIDSITLSATPTSASATIEWPYPADVFGWDTATFQLKRDGESVDVFLEESTDGGGSWTEVAGPIARGDDIPVSSSDKVRFRVDFSRTNTANNPTVDALYRRYTV